MSTAPPLAPMRPAPRVREAYEQDSSPFLPLGQLLRIAFLYYLFAYRLLFPILDTMMSDGSKDLLGARIIAEFYNTVLLAYPFIFYRKEYGWLHPLVLPTVFYLAKSLAKNPFSLFLPFDYPMVDFVVETSSTAAVLAMTNYDMAWLKLQMSLVYCFAQTVYLLAFLFGPRLSIPKLRIQRPTNLAVSALIFIVGLVTIASAFIIIKGGISEVLIAMRSGRRELFEGNGHLVAAGTMSPMIALVWFGYQNKPWRNPVFLGGLGLALLTSLIVSGSRSSMIMPVVTLIMIWWWRSGRALILPTLMAGVFAIFVIGAFGSIRQDYGSTTIDLSVLDPTNFGQTMGRALEDIEARREKEGILAVMAGAEQKGLLWGKSYINAATFWVPRAIWKEKPAGTDVYNLWINYLGNSIDSRPPQVGVWGIPVPAEMEAYWNLGYFGVALLFTFVGLFHATLAKAAHAYRKVPLFWVLYINAILIFSGTAKDFINLCMTTGMILIFAVFAGFFGKRGTTEKLFVVRGRAGA